MPRERVFWIVLASLILVGIAAGFLGNRARTVPLVLAPGADPRPQSATGRSWQEEQLQRIAVIPAGEGQALKNPTLLRLGARGDVYILDSDEAQVERYSAEGKPLAVYSTDIVNPSDVAVGAAGDVWVVDPDKRRIVVLSPEGAAARQIDLEGIPFRLGLDGRGGFVVTFHKRGENLFQSYSSSGKAGPAFGRFFPEDLQSSLTADGWIVNVRPDTFVYPLRHAGLLASYTMDGRLQFLRRTIAPVPLPEVQIDTAGGHRIDNRTPLASISGSVVDGDVYVLSAESSKERVLDVYDAETGTYRFSLHPPEGDARWVALTRDQLFSVTRRGVSIWRRH